MSGRSAEGINFSVTNLSGGEEKKVFVQYVTLEKVKIWIDKKPLDAEIKYQLKKLASTYPERALGNWMQNFDKHLIRAKNVLKSKKKNDFVELGDELPVQNQEEHEAPIERAPTLEDF
jgi:hypothetical protein